MTRKIAALIIIGCGISLTLRAQVISLEEMPPVVVETIPRSGDLNVDPNLAAIRVTFSKDMADQSWSIVQVTPESHPKVSGKPGYLRDKRTFELGVSLEPNKTYAIWLNTDRHTNFRDTDQKPALPYLLVFETRGL